ncbi:MAG: hypothetical protein ACOC22_00050 [bacterium]
MSTDWNEDLKKYVVRKHKELTGEDLPIEAISDVNIDFDVDFNDLSDHDLGNMYSFALMMEKYEFAKKIDTELKLRGCTIDLDLNEEKKNGVINIQTKSKSIIIDMEVLPSGCLMVDFNKLK